MNAPGRPWNMRQLLDSMRAVRRPVEFAPHSGRKESVEFTDSGGRSVPIADTKKPRG